MEESQPIELPPKQTNYVSFVLVAITFLLFGLAGGYYLAKTSLLDQLFAKYMSKTCTLEAKICPDGTAVGRTGPKCEFAPCPTPVDPTANWKTYRIAQFNMEFKLPPDLLSPGELRDLSQTVPSPNTGEVFCLTISLKKSLSAPFVCEGDIFALGAISSDYNIGRGGTFLDLNGFNYKDGKYYLRNATEPLPEEDITKVNNPNGVEILKLKSHWLPPTGQREALPPPYYFGSDKVVGALVNSHDTTFPGFAVKMNLVNGLTEKVFDKILSTFKFTDNAVPQ